MYKMQQRLLKKMKNSRKQSANNQNQQPKQKRISKEQKSGAPLNIGTGRNFNFQEEQHLTSNKKISILQETPSPIGLNPGFVYSNQKPPIPQFAMSTQKKPRTFKFGDSGEFIPTDIITTFIKYDTLLFGKFLLLTPSWHTSVLQAMDEHCNKFENKFIATYQGVLFFKQSYSSSIPIKFCGQRGLKLDRVLECELLDNKSLHPNQSLRISYNYKVFGDRRTYTADYKFDVLKPKKARLTWLHQDNSNRETYTQPIQ